MSTSLLSLMTYAASGGLGCSGLECSSRSLLRERGIFFLLVSLRTMTCSRFFCAGSSRIAEHSRRPVHSRATSGRDSHNIYLRRVGAKAVGL